VDAGCWTVPTAGDSTASAAFERDRRRDATVTRAGYRTLRFAHDHVVREPRTAADTVAGSLEDRRAA
jgi:very-short-patch-repair endonuclease